METFLATTIDKLKSNKYADLNIIMGNESCDLDSAICALVYAAYQHWQYMQIKCKVCTKVHRGQESVDDIFLPILNVDREDFDIKTEVKFCLEEHGIDERRLVFRNDLDLKSLVSSRKTSVTLVDHHVLAHKDKFLTQYVTEIIDHRPMDKTDWSYKDDMRSTIIVNGSCCTLVTQRIKDLSALVAKEDDFFIAYPECTDLLHCGIILDTVNFSKEVNKATPHDEEMVLYLESLLKPNLSYEEERKCKLERLVEARKDISSLTPAQLLRKDLKIVADILVPSFPILVEEFLTKPDAMSAIREALVKRECTIALLLGMSLINGLRRDLAVFSIEHPDRAASLAEHLQQWKNPPLELSLDAAPSSDQSVLYMRQGALSASRKQYIGALHDWLASQRATCDMPTEEKRK